MEKQQQQQFIFGLAMKLCCKFCDLEELRVSFFLPTFMRIHTGLYTYSENIFINTVFF